MQPKNDPDEENHNVLMVLELYRLQSLRNIMVVILMIQLLLVGVGLTMVFEATRLNVSQGTAQPKPNQSPGDHEHGRFQPNEIYRAPEKQHVVAAMARVKQAVTA